ncbi:MAG: chaperone modulator CbpM [Stellaceae bacterium]
MTDIVAVSRLYGLEVRELEHWIGEQWVLPESGAAGYIFHEVDVARVRLIVEMKRELAIDEEAIPVVLRLLDQLYALRRRLKAVTAAIESLPPDLREAVMAKLEGGE